MLSKRFEYNSKTHIKINRLQEKTINEVKNKINNKIYSQEQVSCICGSNEKNTIAKKDRYGFDVTTVICKECGLIRTSPRMTQEAFNQFYDNEYRKIYSGQENIPTNFIKKEINVGKNIYKHVGKQIDLSKKLKILEIGAGAGGILVPFKEKGHEVLGIDLGQEYLNNGADVKLLKCSSHELTNKYEKYFDLVILNHVFEHFLDTHQEIVDIKKLLTKKGCLYISVPGIKNLKNKYNCDLLCFLQNAHNYHFTLSTLEQVLGKQGFKLLKGNEKIISLFQKEKNYKINSRNYFKENTKFFKRLEKYRKVYHFKLKVKNKIKTIIKTRAWKKLY